MHVRWESPSRYYEAVLQRDLLGDWVLSTANGGLRNRLTHHCHIIETGNESYRFRHSSHEAKRRIKTREQTRRVAASQDSEPVEGGASPDGSGTPRIDSRKGGPTEATSL